MGAHQVSRTVRVQPMMRSAVTISASGVQRQIAASAAAPTRISASLPQAGPRFPLRRAFFAIGFRVYGRGTAPDGTRHAPGGPPEHTARMRLARKAAAKEAHRMLKWALIFFVISLVAGYFGFTGVASTTRRVAK